MILTIKCVYTINYFIIHSLKRHMRRTSEHRHQTEPVNFIPRQNKLQRLYFTHETHSIYTVLILNQIKSCTYHLHNSNSACNNITVLLVNAVPHNTRSCTEQAVLEARKKDKRRALDSLINVNLCFQHKLYPWNLCSAKFTRKTLLYATTKRAL